MDDALDFGLGLVEPCVDEHLLRRFQPVIACDLFAGEVDGDDVARR